MEKHFCYYENSLRICKKKKKMMLNLKKVVVAKKKFFFLDFRAYEGHLASRLTNASTSYDDMTEITASFLSLNTYYTYDTNMIIKQSFLMMGNNILLIKGAHNDGIRNSINSSVVIMLLPPHGHLYTTTKILPTNSRIYDGFNQSKLPWSIHRTTHITRHHIFI